MTTWRRDRFCYQCGEKVLRQTSVGRVVTRDRMTSCERLCHACLNKEQNAQETNTGEPT